jgi:hypothetical protein
VQSTRDSSDSYRIVATAMSAVSGAQAQQGPATSDRPKKLQRISQACDLCHRRSIRCRPSIENAQVQCQNCFDFGVACTYNRPSRRRRNPSVGHATPPNILPQQQQQQQRQSVVRKNPFPVPFLSLTRLKAQVAHRGHLGWRTWARRPFVQHWTRLHRCLCISARRQLR